MVRGVRQYCFALILALGVAGMLCDVSPARGAILGQPQVEFALGVIDREFVVLFGPFGRRVG